MSDEVRQLCGCSWTGSGRRDRGLVAVGTDERRLDFFFEGLLQRLTDEDVVVLTERGRDARRNPLLQAGGIGERETDAVRRKAPDRKADGEEHTNICFKRHAAHTPTLTPTRVCVC